MRKYFWPLLFFIALIIIGLLLYRDFNSKSKTKNIMGIDTRDSSCQYQYVNPLRCEPGLAKQKKEYVSLRNDLLGYLDKEKSAGKLTVASVYFRDLQNGPIMSINGNQDFFPASLLKVPLMITYFQKAEKDSNLLQKKVRASGDATTPVQDIIPGKTAELGKEYTIDDLIGLMITESDNVSWKMLLAYLRKAYSEEDYISTLSDLGIIDPRKSVDNQYVTAQLISSLFRVLYNSSYLNIEMSDKALKLLTQSSFKDGIVAGVPQDTPVAHKFGESENGKEIEFHDCGIIYYSSDPYILCVLTKGSSLTDLEQIAKEVSQKVYQEVDKRN